VAFVELASEWCPATLLADAPAGTVVVTLRGELDIASVDLLRQVLDEAAASGCPRVVVDAGALRFLDLAGLRILLHLQDQLRSRGGELRLRDARPIVRTLIRATGAEGRLALDGLAALDDSGTGTTGATS
jgi:anti-sigma B factor antagonist